MWWYIVKGFSLIALEKKRVNKMYNEGITLYIDFVQLS